MNMRRHLRTLLIIIAGLLLVCLLAAGIAAVSNRTLPTSSTVIDHLSEAEKARLAEAIHLRQTLGEAAWPGWGQADIPMIVYNEAYVFLVGYADPPAGWQKVPQQEMRGSAWEPVPGDTFQGQTYYRQRLPQDGTTPQAFTVQVGDRWASSLQTKEWMEISLVRQIQEDLPPPLAAIIPYKLVVQLFINSSDWYIAALLHETFHAYEGITAPQRLAEGESAVSTGEAQYPWDSTALQEAWQTELDLLVESVNATSEAEQIDLVRRFLAQRSQRRKMSGLDETLVAYERQREWVEGLAKYIELEIWRQAATTPQYEPLPAMQRDDDFENYTTFAKRWSQEVAQIGRMAGDEGDGRFYYSGMAQAYLLDQLMPDWKTRIMAEDIWLDELLASAVANAPETDSKTKTSIAKQLPSQAPQDAAELATFLDNFLVPTMAAHHVPGAAVVFVKDGEIFLAKGYGYADLENKVPVDPETTIFRMASVSRLFPIAGVLQLAEKGQINLENSVNRYVLGWHVQNSFEEPVRVRYLLLYTDGFGARDLETFALSPRDLRPLGQVLSEDLDPPLWEPGRFITYGCYGPALAGYLITEVSGTRFKDYVQANFFEPLEMDYSVFSQQLLPEQTGALATIYNYDGQRNGFAPAPFLYLRMCPAGGLSASATDIAHFMIALLNDGRYQDAQILTAASAQSMLEQQFAPYPGLPGVTYGFMEQVENGRRGLVHEGSSAGGYTQVYLLPEHNLGYIYVQNSGGDEVATVLNKAFLDRYFPAPAPAPVAIDDSDLDRFTGVYRPTQTNEHTLAKLEALLAGEVRVTAVGNRLAITPLGNGDVYGGFDSPAQWAEIEPGLFQRLDQEQYVAFRQDEKGTYLFSGSGYHGTYYRLQPYETSTVQRIWLGLCLLVFVSTIIIWPFGLLNGGQSGTAAANIARWGGVAASTFCCLGFAGAFYALFLKRIAGFPAFTFGISPLATAMLAILVTGVITGAGVLIWAMDAWRNGYWSRWGRLHYTLLAITIVAFTWWLNYWNLLGFRF